MPEQRQRREESESGGVRIHLYTNIDETDKLTCSRFLLVRPEGCSSGSRYLYADAVCHQSIFRKQVAEC
jgi:hypothetical protein